MTGLQRIQQAMFEIRMLLLGNSNIRKLISNDSSNAMSLAAPTIGATRQHISMTPVFRLKQPGDSRGTLVSITLASTEFADGTMTHNAEIRINLFSDASLWPLDGEKIRPIELLSEVIQTLSKRQMGASNNLTYHSSELVVVDGNVHGYSAVFTLEDGVGEDNAF